MKRPSKPVILFALLLLGMIAGGLGLFEVFRNKGRIQVTAGAVDAPNGELALTIVVSNLDWRVSLDQIQVGLDVNSAFSLGRVLTPGNLQISTSSYGPSNQWKEIAICYPSAYSLKPRQAFALEVLLVPNPMLPTNRISGRVAYRGAQIWERVGMGQINGVYFRAPINDSRSNYQEQPTTAKQ